MLNLNGYTVECKPGAGFLSDVIKVVGKANTIKGPGTGEYTMVIRKAVISSYSE